MKRPSRLSNVCKMDNITTITRSFCIIVRPPFVMSLPAVALDICVMPWHMYIVVDFVTSQVNLNWSWLNDSMQIGSAITVFQSSQILVVGYENPNASSALLLASWKRFVCGDTDKSASLSRHFNCCWYDTNITINSRMLFSYIVSYASCMWKWKVFRNVMQIWQLMMKIRI